MPTLSPEREKEILAELGLEERIEDRYERPKDLPSIPARLRPKFWESMQLIDPVETAAFERFIPRWCVVDSGIDPYVFDEELSFTILVRTDKPPPVDSRIAAGIRAGRVDPSNYGQIRYAMLASDLEWQYNYLGATRMARPLVFRAGASPQKRHYFRRARKVWPVPFVGIHVKLVVDVTDGRLKDDMKAGLGVLLPKRGRRLFGGGVDKRGNFAHSDVAPSEAEK